MVLTATLNAQVYVPNLRSGNECLDQLSGHVGGARARLRTSPPDGSAFISHSRNTCSDITSLWQADLTVGGGGNPAIYAH